MGETLEEKLEKALKASFQDSEGLCIINEEETMEGYSGKIAANRYSFSLTGAKGYDKDILDFFYSLMEHIYEFKKKQ